MQKYALILTILFTLLLFYACDRPTPPLTTHYIDLKPAYSGISLEATSDTLHFPLTEFTYNKVRTFNVFNEGNTSFFFFYDKASKSINVYNYQSRNLVKNVPLKKWVRSSKLDKAEVYMQGFDSIFVTLQKDFLILDSSGRILKHIEFPDGFENWGEISNTTPIIVKGNDVLLAIKPFLSGKSVEEQRKFRLMYDIDIAAERKTQRYALPDPYMNHIYGNYFVDYSYCLNDKGNLVFSFAADPNIYETDLIGLNNAYNGRSIHQKDSISPIEEKLADNMDENFKHFNVNYSYGSIYFDPFRKIYLRMATQKITESEFRDKTRKREKSIIFFDHNLKIIGESKLDTGFAFNHLFFTADGAMYARTNHQDEHALHFVKLAYSQPDSVKASLTALHSKN